MDTDHKTTAPLVPPAGGAAEAASRPPARVNVPGEQVLAEIEPAEIDKVGDETSSRLQPAVEHPGTPAGSGVVRHRRAEQEERRPEGQPPASYLDLARSGRGRGRHYLLGTTIIIVVGSALAILTLVAAEELLPTWLPAMTPTLTSFIPEFLITLAVVVLIHRRDWRTVITPRPRIEPAAILRPAGTWALIMVVVTVPCAIADPDGLRFGPTTWTGFAIAACIAILLIPIQATAEELFFRGHLIQWASLATRRRWALATISGVLFALPHLTNPELAGLQGAAILLGPLPYFTFGYTFAWISITTGSIEAAIGAHIINNLLLATLMGASDSALESTTLITDTSPNYLLNVISTIVGCAVFARITSGHGRPVDQPSSACLAAR